MAATDRGLEEIAHRYLPEEAARRWARLLRPGLVLRMARECELVAVRMGGIPSMPADTQWPMWDGVGPLCFVASVHAEAVPVAGLDIPFPRDGTLLLFYRDPRLDDFMYVQERGDPETQAAARILYVPAGTRTIETAPPEGVTTYGRVDLTTEASVNGPRPGHPVLQAAVADMAEEIRELMDDSFGMDDFRMALSEHAAWPRHRIGGYGEPVQDPVELDFAAGRPGSLAFRGDASQWTLLVQIDTDFDADMVWGGGSLYWFMRPEDMADRRFDRARFAWQA